MVPSQSALDGRRHVLIDYGDASRFHTVSVKNVAELVRLAAQRPGDRVLNCGDPDPPTTLAIARAAWAHLGHDAPVEVLLEGGLIQRNMVARRGLFRIRLWWTQLQPTRGLGGYLPATTYAASVGVTFNWLEQEVAPGDWRTLLPQLAAYPWNLFDYEAEDGFLAERAQKPF